MRKQRPRRWIVSNLALDEENKTTLLTDLMSIPSEMRWQVIRQATEPLEKIDPGLLEAARDLYSRPSEAFRKVVLPLSLPGVFAGTLLTFIPAAGDYINAELLGNVKTGMIGSQIAKLFLKESNYPEAAALSFIFMAIITTGVQSMCIGQVTRTRITRLACQCSMMTTTIELSS